ncbi:hypothetical protein WJX73_001340 [Symbiochloris irregularis]|uniref:Proteasome activator subunit 4 n=1 Tax=Symbiochloris irregularis TaxID=706552 RepID=A0AAW1NS02_9CHLO
MDHKGSRSIWREWLPEDLLPQVQSEEPHRFSRTLRAFANEWKQNSDMPSAQRCLESLKWVSVFKSSMTTWHRPEACSDAPGQAYSGLAMYFGEQNALSGIIHRSRRFFAPDAAQEIWDAFSPALSNMLTPQCLEALGWLVLFLPTCQATIDPKAGAWDAWLGTILDTWQAVAPCDFFQHQALGFVARLAKHDCYGVVQWQKHMSVLYTHMLWSFHVPVGTATAKIPFGRGSSIFNKSTFSLDSYERSDSAGKLAIYLLQRGAAAAHADSLQNGSMDDASAPASVSGMAHLERLADLLENYYHPSNNGTWDKSLASLLSSLTKYMGKRLVFERSPKLDEDQDGYEAAGVSLQSHDAREPMDEDTTRRLAAVVVKLAGPAQFAKSYHQQAAACNALAVAAYVAPDLVLSLAYQRFQEGLQAVNAVHQLNGAIHLWGLCLRPLLLCGEAYIASSIAPDAPQVPVGEAIAASLMAVLPGIDANDPSKCLTVFRFCCSALLQLPALPEHSGQAGLIPLDTELWLDELLSRIFTILENLEAPDTRSETAAGRGSFKNIIAGSASAGGSFLLEKQSMFRPLFGLLFARLPRPLALQALKRIQRFVTSTTLPSVMREVSAMCQEAQAAGPKESMSELALPLLQHLKQELSSDGELSMAQAARLQWQLSVIDGLTPNAGTAILSVKKQLADVLRLALSSSSQEVQEAGETALVATLGGLTNYYLSNAYGATHKSLQPAAKSGREAHGLLVQAWGDVKYTAAQPTLEAPEWHMPSPEELAFAEELVSEHLENAARALLAECGSPNVGATSKDRQHLRGLLLSMTGCLIALGSALPGLDPQVEANGDSLAVIGKNGVLVGNPESRALVAQALVAAAGALTDSELLEEVSAVMQYVVCPSHFEWLEYEQQLGGWREDSKVINEPAIAGMLDPQGQRWCKRWPRWLLSERALAQHLWRGSQASFRPWLSTQCLDPPPSSLPQPVKDVLAALVPLSMHTYAHVRNVSALALKLALKRTPKIAPMLMPPYLGALSGVQLQLGSWDSADGTHCLEESLQQLLPAIGQPASTVAMSAAAASREEGEVAGASSVLQAMPFFRFVSRNSTALAAISAAVMASSSRAGIKTASSIARIFSGMVVRLIRPPELLAAQMEHQPLPAGMQALQARLREVTASNAPHSLHWRYIIMAEALQIVLLPPQSSEAAAAAASRALTLLTSPIPGQRGIGSTQLLYILQPAASWQTEGMLEAVGSSVRAKLQAEPQWGQLLMDQLTHAQPTLNQDNHGQSSMSGLMSRLMAKPEDLVVESISQASAHLTEWPRGRTTPAPLNNDTFHLDHARVIQALAQLSPSEVVQALKGPLQAAVQQGQRDNDRAASHAAAEVLAGLLASGTVFQPGEHGGQSAWDDWVRDTLVSALEAAPMDLHDAWAVAVRYAVHWLSRSDQPFLKLLLPAVLQMPPSGAPSSAAVRRLKLMAACLGEFSNLGACGTRTSSGEELRLPATAQAREAAHSLQASFLGEVPELSLQTGETARKCAATCTVLALAPAIWMQQGTEQGSLAPEVHSVLEYIVQGMQEGVEAIAAASATPSSEPSSPMQSADSAMMTSPKPSSAHDNGAPLMSDPRVVRLGLLPLLLRVQELTAPEAQPLALEAKMAAALVKYVHWPESVLQQVAGLISTAPSMEPWKARGAAIAFTQHFWFRHVFLLGNAGAASIQEATMQLLRDSKLEVQENAAALLAGLLTGQSPAQVTQLRDQCLSAAERLFPKGKRRRKADAATNGEAALADRHAAVLALKAFVLSTPYDVPAWLPPVLVALMRASSQPAPVSATLRKTLQEFRRTHEEGSLQQVRTALGEDQWDALRDIASPASYFA